jgi:mono/diheme cytochrome c family protein
VKNVDLLPVTLVLIGVAILATVGFTRLSPGAPATAMPTDRAVHSPDTGGAVLPPPPPLDPARVARGEQLYTQHCASCHGTNLEGQPNWKKPLPDGRFPAPPHDDSGHTWHHPDALLVSIILDGGNGLPGAQSNMPGFRAVLNEDDARQILDFFRSRWSPQSREFQHMIELQTP